MGKREEREEIAWAMREFQAKGGKVADLGESDSGVPKTDYHLTTHYEMGGLTPNAGPPEPPRPVPDPPKKSLRTVSDIEVRRFYKEHPLPKPDRRPMLGPWPESETDRLFRVLKNRVTFKSREVREGSNVVHGTTWLALHKMVREGWLVHYGNGHYRVTVEGRNAIRWGRYGHRRKLNPRGQWIPAGSVRGDDGLP